MLNLIARAVLFLIAVLVACPIRVHLAQTGLDASWAVALNDAASRGLIHGRDIAFTYGPWAWVALPMGANIDAAVKWQIAMWAVYAGAVGYLFFFRKIGLLNLALFAACVFEGARTFSDYGYAGPDIFLAFTVLLLLVCAADSMYWLLFLCFAIALTGALFLIKLTSGIFAASAIVLWVIASKRPVGMAAALFGIPAALAAAFFLHYPSLEVLTMYVRAALDISSGFSVAMSTPGETAADIRDVSLLAIGFIALAAVLAWRKQHKAFAIALSLAGPLFLSFKHSFIRPAGHMEIFFTTAPLLLGAVVLATDFEGRKNWPVLAVIAAMALVWIPRSGTLSTRAWPVLSVTADPAELAADRIENLPRVPTAVFPYESAIPIVSGVESRPFPVIQAYQSYTRSLDAWNASAIVKAEQIVVHWDTVDGRHPFLDAPALTLAMMEHYDFAQDLGHRILLKRRATPRFTSFRKTGDAVLKIGEALKMPPSTKPQLMRVDLKLNLRGQLMKLLWKLPPAQILLSAPGGRVLAARLVPDVLGNPGGLSFMPSSLDDLRKMLEKDILTDPYNEIVIAADYYEREAKVEYFEIEDWKGVTLERDASLDLTKLLNQGEARAAKIDTINDSGVASLGATEIAAVPAASGYVIVKGWAFDFFDTKPASAVYLQVDGNKFVKTTYGQSRMDNVALFNHNYALAPTGFSAAIPNSRLGPGVHELRVIVISVDGKKYATGAKQIRFQTR